MKRRHILKAAFVLPAAPKVADQVPLAAITAKEQGPRLNLARREDVFLGVGSGVKQLWRTSGLNTTGLPFSDDWSSLHHQGCEITPYWHEKDTIHRGSLTVVSDRPNMIQAFTQGRDGVLFSEWTDGGGWTGLGGWRNIGGVGYMRTLRAVSRTQGIIDVFTIGDGGTIFTTRRGVGEDWNGEWRGIGSPPDGAESIQASTSPDWITLYVVSRDGRVYTSSWSTRQPAWREWVALAGSAIFPKHAHVEILVTNPGTWFAGFNLFAVGEDQHVYHFGITPFSPNPATSWKDIGGNFFPGGKILAVDRGLSNIDLFVGGNDSNQYASAYRSGGAWSPWKNLGRPPGSVGGAPELVIRDGVGGYELICAGAGGAYSMTHRSLLNPLGPPSASTWRKIMELTTYAVGNFHVVARQVSVAPYPASWKLDAQIGFPSGVPVGGWSSVEFFPDGRVKFSGHLHDSGLPSYDTRVAWAVVTRSGRAYTFGHAGHVNGTLEPGSRDDDWEEWGSHPHLREHWQDLVGGRWHWEAKVDLDLEGTIGTTLLVLAYAARIAEAVNVIGPKARKIAR